MRLHVVVQPSLRYRLPEVAHAVRNFVLGNATSQSTLDALAALVASFHSSAEAGIPEHDSVADGLMPACAIVCTHARAYLETLAAAWVESLAETQRGAARLLRRAFAKIDEVEAVRLRLRGRNPQLVDREYYAELAQLRLDTEKAIADLCASPVPAISCPDALLRSTQDLEETFAEGYSSGTERNLASIRHFEAEMNPMQNIVARDFANRVAPMISDTMKIGSAT